MRTRTARILKWTGAVVVASGVLYAVLLGLANRSLRRAYSALEADGRPMQPAEIVPPAIPGTENAALVYQAVVLQLKAEPAGEQDLFTTLGDLAAEMNKEPTNGERTARFRELLQDSVVMDALGALERGTKKPGCQYELDYSQGAGILLPHLSDLRQLTRILCAVAHVQAADGDHAGMWNTLITALRLANAVKDEPILVSQLVRIAQFNLTVDTIHALAAAAPSDEQYAEISTLLNSYDDNSPLVAAMDGERVLLGEWVFGLPRSDLRQAAALLGDGAVPALAMACVFRPVFHFDHAAYLGVMHAYTRNAVEPYSEADAALVEELLNNVPRYCVFTRILVPALSQIKGRHFGMVARARITRAGLAALRYRRKHGAYPPSLAAVEARDFTDPFSGEPLIYRGAPKGFAVYSVGMNLADDGGAPAEDGQSGDIIWRYAEEAGAEPAS
ncbi:MAG: hypothetical protein RBS80_26600 [Thermoguttaceae bacterium]|nr:hypothetical protein [Thermoguttaceae bacterium]